MREDELHRDALTLARELFGPPFDERKAAIRAAFEANDRVFLQHEAQCDPELFLRICESLGVGLLPANGVDECGAPDAELHARRARADLDAALAVFAHKYPARLARDITVEDVARANDDERSRYYRLAKQGGVQGSLLKYLQQRLPQLRGGQQDGEP